MRIAYTNLVDSASSVTGLTEDLIYPVANVQNQRLEKSYRTTAITSQTVVVDLGAASTVETVAIVGHNLTASATLAIEAHTADSWTSPSVTTSLTATTNMVLRYGDLGSYRYWRYTISDDTNTAGYLEIGRLWLGGYLDIDPSSLLDFTVSKRRDDTVNRGRGQQKYATQGVGWRNFRLSFPRTGGTMLTSIQTLYDTVGNFDSVIFSNFNSLRTYELVEPVYCSIVGDIDFRHTRSMYFNYTLELQEDR